MAKPAARSILTMFTVSPLENPNDPNSRIIGLGFSHEIAATTVPPLDVQELRPRIYYKQLGELCVPGKIRASTVFPIVEAFQDKDELWHVRTEPDGFEPGNLRSVKQC